MLGSVFAILVALIWALSATLVRGELDRSNFLSVSLIVSVTGAIIFVPLGLLLTPLSTFYIEGVMLFMLAGLLQPGFGRLLF